MATNHSSLKQSYTNARESAIHPYLQPVNILNMVNTMYYFIHTELSSRAYIHFVTEAQLHFLFIYFPT